MKKVKISGVSSAKFMDMNNVDLLKMVEKTRDQDAFEVLFARFENMVRESMAATGTEVSKARHLLA